ncbi:CDR4 [Cyberlindnera jadinii]|uniref:CDR4 protein n=1 Tax=Cyberlindnera jadinii (strain ATCC 18201 / CBS 1600 / BCRC 20928 / JCM 3617 / NBRC 0987 / NRRL Y-1542) TaxID=983966 RepID=A0A0H5C8J4_CYBJN|nr:CDR4 [Cyberlindnera jadinii]
MATEDSVENDKGPKRYMGFNSRVEEQVQQLVRTFTNQSLLSVDSKKRRLRREKEPQAELEQQQQQQQGEGEGDSDRISQPDAEFHGDVDSEAGTAEGDLDSTTESHLSRVTSKASTIAPGINPMAEELDELDPRLDPDNEEFSSRYWIKNIKAFMDRDPEHYLNYSFGIAFKNLRASGEATDADYQTTSINAPLKFAGQYAKRFLSSKTAKRKSQFDILKHMDGLVRPGEILVVLGRPGSGCTTLLKSIAANTHGFEIGEESQISYDGLSPHDIRKHFRGDIVYQAESDIHFPHLTVWQTLFTAARFRTPQNRIPGVTRDDYAAAMTNVYMATYGLLHTKNTKVGSELVRGVSGGERKRVSIAEVSLAGAKLQCWDNATRGLDAATALEFIRALRTSADVLDTTAIIAIYQCSQDAYDLFDKVSVLYDGYQIFFGRADEAKQYFLKMGWECPQRQTTADFLTSVTSPRERIPRKGYEDKVPRTAKEFETYWKNSPEYAELIAEVDSALNGVDQSTQFYASKHARQARHMRKSSPYTVSFPMQVRYLLTRNFQRIRNDLGYNLFSILADSLISLVISSIFYNLPSTTSSFYHRGASLFFAVLFNGFSCFLEIMSLFEGRPIVEKHKQYGLYHPSAEALSSVISQFPSKLFIALFFNLIYYFMVNFRREPGYFFFYFLVNVLATLTMSHFFRLIGSMFKTLPQALVPAHVVLLALVVFTGFIVPINYMLGWCRWINYIDPIAYAFESLMLNEFHNRIFQCSSYIPQSPAVNPDLPPDSWICDAVGAVAGQTYVNGTIYLEQAFQYRNGHKWRNVGIVIGFMIFFLAGYMFFSEYNESAQQKGEILLFQRSTLRKLKKDKALNDIEAGKERDITLEPEEEDVNVDAIQAGTDIFHWRDVHYTIKIQSEYREILSGVDGWVKPGTLTALMGASGAGKTTLLDVLASRVTMGVVTGSMFVNGHLRDSSFQRSTGYVQQQDLHLATATVREALRFSAYLRQPYSVSKKDKDKYVEEVIKILDMQKYADAVVGVAGEGLNVEQRKRLTIGVELAAKPKLLLFLDEPTSGLDSQTAWSICQLMRKLANHGQAILCTIHQPSAILMQEFDRLLFLASGGRTVYFGDLGDHCQTLIDYFENHGSPKCPPDANPAEWMLSLIGAAPGSHANQDYHQVWMESEERKSVLEELNTMERELVKLPYDSSVNASEYAAPLWYQFIVVLQRVFQMLWRTPSYIWAKLFLSVSSSIFIGFVFFNADLTIQGLQNQMFAVFMFLIIFNPVIQQQLPQFVAQRDLYEVRERPSKTFSWKVFILTQLTAEVPWNILLGTLSFFVFYYPAGFYHNAEPTDRVNQRGAYAWFFTCMFFVYVGTFGQLCISPLEIADSAGQVATLSFTLCLTFCGVLVGPDALPGFWIFMYRVSPFTYYIDGFLSNALANAPVTCSTEEYKIVNPPMSNMTCADYLDPYLEAAGTGYLVNGEASSQCELCPMSSTNAFLTLISSKYSRRWRNVGIFFVYIGFDIVGAVFLYWLRRVPKKKNRVKDEQPASVSSPRAEPEKGERSPETDAEKLSSTS